MKNEIKNLIFWNIFGGLFLCVSLWAMCFYDQQYSSITDKPIEPKAENYINRQKVNLYCWEKEVYADFYDVDRDGYVDAIVGRDRDDFVKILFIADGYENHPDIPMGMTRQTLKMTQLQRNDFSYYKAKNEQTVFYLAKQHYWENVMKWNEKHPEDKIPVSAEATKNQ